MAWGVGTTRPLRTLVRATYLRAPRRQGPAPEWHSRQQPSTGTNVNSSNDLDKTSKFELTPRDPASPHRRQRRRRLCRGEDGNHPGQSQQDLHPTGPYAAGIHQVFGIFSVLSAVAPATQRDCIASLQLANHARFLAETLNIARTEAIKHGDRAQGCKRVTGDRAQAQAARNRDGSWVSTKNRKVTATSRCCAGSAPFRMQNGIAVQDDHPVAKSGHLPTCAGLPDWWLAPCHWRRSWSARQASTRRRSYWPTAAGRASRKPMTTVRRNGLHYTSSPQVAALRGTVGYAQRARNRLFRRQYL
jgi:hypothetical protein